MVRRKKIAISIIFSLCEREAAQRDFQDFFFSHFPLFESHMNRLKGAIEKVRAPGSIPGKHLNKEMEGDMIVTYLVANRGEICSLK
jgi:hypothetical protein